MTYQQAQTGHMTVPAHIIESLDHWLDPRTRLLSDAYGRAVHLAGMLERFEEASNDADKSRYDDDYISFGAVIADELADILGELTALEPQ